MASDKSRNYFVDLLVILVLVALGFAAYKFAPLHYSHWKLKGEVRDYIVTTERQTTTTEINNTVRKILEKYDVQVADEDLVVKSDTQLKEVRLRYVRTVGFPLTSKQVTVDFTLDDRKDFNFD
ncbi:MAG: hypothetical protein RBU45_09950 [Myxococcota bacterium]|jgi:hypothetical protein|nr:hypothetical protein [Myxococcota bacterium]